MTRRHKKVSMLFSAALLLGMTLGALPRIGLLYAADVRGNSKHQGKVGDVCTTASDCEKAPVELNCTPTADGKQKQCSIPPHRILPPT